MAGADDNGLRFERSICIYRSDAALVYLAPCGAGQLLFLADGRLFVRRDDGTVGEADPAERDYAYVVLDLLEAITLHPSHGFAMSPQSDS